MRAVQKRPRFLLDLAEELTYLNDHVGAGVANRWYEDLMATIEELKRQPFLGRERKDLKPPTVRTWRLTHFPRWLVFYQVDQDAIVFLRVRSGVMDLQALEMD